MAKKWYVVHTYSGFENKVKKSLEERVKQEALQDFFGEVLIPMEVVQEMVKGEKKTSKRKFFPGYILVNMEMTDSTWHLVKGTAKVTGFVGSAKNPKDVPSITDAEVSRLTAQISEGSLKPKPKYMFDKGEQVRINEGPFTSFNGVVDEVNLDKNTLKVMVTIFGRSTPVELDFLQVEKI